MSRDNITTPKRSADVSLPSLSFEDHPPLANQNPLGAMAKGDHWQTAVSLPRLRLAWLVGVRRERAGWDEIVRPVDGA